MATLLLGAVGTLIGARVGGAVGTLVGQAIDQRLFPPKPREGPRLQDLRVQTSTYGSPIPRLYGRMRIAGTVIWATDLVESRSRRSGGKGRPATVSYSYSASFAVLLSARPVRAVHRIWADGNLLRGEAGDWKGETGFRLHLGGEDQPLDPLIAAAEEHAPAYRGAAYAVFEALALEPFGNRIPALTFEIEADAEPVAIATILADLAQDAVVPPEAAAPIGGYAASDGQLADLIETLAPLTGGPAIECGGRLAWPSAASPIATLAADEIAWSDEELDGNAAPAEAELAYFDPARDYLAGLQRARRPGRTGAAIRLALPAALSAGQAKTIAADALHRAESGSRSRSIRCGWRRIALPVGGLVAIAGEGGRWRVVRKTIDRDGVRLDLAQVAEAPRLPVTAAAGRALAAIDRPHGPTTVHLLDLPPLGDAPPPAPRLWIAAAGVSPGWRRASLLLSRDGGASWEPIGRTAPPAVIGTAASALPAAAVALVDRRHHVDVDLLHPDMVLGDADAARLLAGANLALLGDELLQFGRAEPLGGHRWRLSELLRGRRGTGAAGQAPGARFVLIDADALLAHDLPLVALGGTVRLLAAGPGDAQPAEAEANGVGAALRPLAPVQFRADRRADGGFDLRWIRCSRSGWLWRDGGDVPIAEEREAYALDLAIGDRVRRVEIGVPRFHYDAAALAADRLVAAAARLSVRQLGTHAASPPAELTLLLTEAS